MSGPHNLKHRGGGVKDANGKHYLLPTSSPSPSSSNVAAENSKGRRGFTAAGLNCISKQSLLVLTVGLLLGYVVLPMILVDLNASAFPSIQIQPSSLTDQSNIQMRLVQDQKILSRQSLPTDRSPLIMETAVLSDHRRKKILVTGGAGFVGSHLVDKLMMEGHEVTVLDNLFTGQKKNVAHWFHHPNFK